MKKIFLILLMVFVALPVFADSFNYGVNEITIPDGNPDADHTYTNSWYNGSGGVTKEDQEVEPGMSTDQKWDLEGFFFEENKLSMVGGFDFMNGVTVAGRTWTSGDIFISKTKPDFGDITDTSTSGNLSVSNAYGFDYVFDLNFDGMTYDVIQLGDDATVLTADVADNQGSNPWKYDGGGTVIKSGLSFFSLTNVDTDFMGDSHYALTGFDLLFLGHETEFYSHFTMECGNDNLMGKGAVVPEPAPMMLLGSGLVGLGFYRRKR